MTEGKVLELVPAGPAGIEVYEGLSRTAVLEQIIRVSRWWLHPDGRFLLVAEPGTARADLYPVPGVWTRDSGGTIALQAKSSTSDGQTLAIDGRLIEDDVGRLSVDVLHTTQTLTGLRRTRIRLPVQAPDSPVGAAIGGIAVPLVAAVRMSGTTGGVSFADLPGELSLLPSSADPVEIHLATDPMPIPITGELLWTVMAPEVTGRYDLTVQGGVLRCRVESGPGTLCVSWSSPPPSMPVPARTAELELRFAGGKVLGHLHASGVLWGNPLDYQATIEGEALTRLEPDFESCWRSPMPVEDMVHPGESDWRRLRDYGFALTLAGRHPEAVPVLRQALEGCRRDQQGDPQLLPDLANILTRLLHCLPDETPLPEMMGLLRQAVGVQKDASAVQHLRGATRETVNFVFDSLAGQLERRREKLAGDLERIDLLEGSVPFFAEVLDLAIDLDLAEVALVASERGRARALLDQLGLREPGLPVRDAVRARTAAELLELSYGCDVLEYHLTPGRTVVLWISRGGGLEYTTLPYGSKKIDPVVDQVTRSAGQNALRELHDLVLDPLPAHWLSAGKEVPLLAIVPHGSLFSAPWAALPDRDQKRLLDTHAVMVLPALAVLAFAPTSAPSKAPVLGALAGPRPMPIPPTGSDPLPLLPNDFAADIAEVVRHHSASGAVAQVGAAATRDALTALLQSVDAAVIGTHAESHAHDPERTFLAVSAENDSGRVTLDDLAAIRSQAHLVVLLTCWSAAGKISADGVLGLARALLIGGTPALLAGLWDVPADPGVDFVDFFLDAWIGQGLDPARALRQAQLRTSARHPLILASWAGFQLIGTTHGGRRA